MENKQFGASALRTEGKYNLIDIAETYLDNTLPQNIVREGNNLFQRNKKQQEVGDELHCNTHVQKNRRINLMTVKQAFQVNISGGTNKSNIVMDVCYHPHNQGESVDEAN